ncbi:hypothetical protein [Zavarzinella formosa]|uniref:hypothetical protein n=1 Tax=Zavarzinella formosa TaxID=360055 RepID=UPI0003011858|nr:hypothetical protein [Zavarzinella formosa]
MSNDRLKILRQLIEPATLGYLVMAAAGLIVYFFMMSTRGGDIMALIAIVFAVPGILFRWTGSPIIVLLLTTYGLIDPGFLGLLNFLASWRWSPMITSSFGFNLEDLLLATALLSYLIGHYRLNALVGPVLPNDPSVRREIPSAAPVSRPFTQVDAEELPRTLIIGGACVVVGQAGWFFVTVQERFMRPHPFDIGVTRAMILLWVIGSALMILSAGLSYLRISRMTQAEASMVLRDDAFHETRRETDRIERWRRWFKAKMSRRRAGR